MKLQVPVPKFCMITRTGDKHQVVYFNQVTEAYGELWFEVEDNLTFDEVLNRVRHIPDAEPTIRLILRDGNNQVWI